MPGFLDTSLTVRYLTGDPPDMAATAAELMDGPETLYVTEGVLAETAHVLTSVYRRQRSEIVDALIRLLRKRNILAWGLNKADVITALLLCRDSNRVSFADALLWVTARSSSTPTVFSFDRRFPAEGMLSLGMHPDPRVEVALSWAYSRWLTEDILPHDEHIKTLVYLPFNDPKAAERTVEYFTGKPGVVGFEVTSARHRPVHDNIYMRLYRMLEERDLPLAFHAGFHDWEQINGGMNKFISVHAIGFVLYNLVHITNMVINGIPERFPKLKIIWIESGLAWLPFIMQRLDNEYTMCTSEAPLLKKMPSDYMRNFFYTSQPMEIGGSLEALQLAMKMIDAERQLLFSSDYPHWDFNLPSCIYDLPFLGEPAKRSILGLNAQKLFKLGGKRPKPAGA